MSGTELHESVKMVKDEEEMEAMSCKARIAYSFVRTLDSGGRGKLCVRRKDCGKTGTRGGFEAVCIQEYWRSDWRHVQENVRGRQEGYLIWIDLGKEKSNYMRKVLTREGNTAERGREWK